MKPGNEKQKFVAALRKFGEEGGDRLYDPVYNRTGYRPHRGEQMLAIALAKYLDDPKIPGDAFGINWYHDLCEHLVDAFVEFRTHDKWNALREAYKIQTEGEEICDLVDMHVGGLHRLLVVNQVAYLAAVLSGEVWLRPKLEAHFHAQRACVDQAWERFVRIGYRELMPRIKEESHRGNRGEFGKTSLLTYAMSGRVVFTFKRGDDMDDVQMTYVADDTDMWGVRSGSNATRTPFQTCIDMINEVSDNWDLKKMKRDNKVGMF